jgi:hypothetical protein
VLAEGAQFVRPEALVKGNPIVNLLKWLRLEPVTPLSSDATRAHQSRSQQKRQVLRNGGPTHCKSFGKGTDRLFALSKQIKQCTSSGIGDGVKDVASGLRASPPFSPASLFGRRKHFLTIYT